MGGEIAMFIPSRFVEIYEAECGTISDPARNGLLELSEFISSDPHVRDLRWAAYMLATVKHECANMWQPIHERGTRQYFAKMYDPPSARAKSLGNTQIGDGYVFRGRGYVQITGRANYKRMSGLAGDGQDFAANPEAVLEPATSYRILSVGMRHGTFTGRKLAHYLNETASDYRNARRIINGLDQCDRIAAYAHSIERMLSESLDVFDEPQAA